MKTIPASSHHAFLSPKLENNPGHNLYPAVPINLQTPPPPSGLSRHEIANDLFLQVVHTFVWRRLPDEIQVQALASAVFLTRVQVFRKIKALTGQSPSRFMRTIRLQKALELLRTTGRPIAEIAYSVGFTDPKYFSRVFVVEFGGAPSAFRQ